LAPVESIIPSWTSLILTAPTIQLCEEQGAPSEGVAVGNLPRQEIEPDKAVADLFDTMAAKAANRAGKDAVSGLLEKPPQTSA